MNSVGIFYGSSGGSTAEAAYKIANELSRKGFKADVVNIAEATHDTFDRYHNIILGTSTMGMGVLQDDWENMLVHVSEADLTGKKVAIFGTGDQETYPDTFADGMGVLFDTVKGAGGLLVGKWSTDGYKFRESHAVVDRDFVGLVLDADTQPLHSTSRIRAWVDELSEKFDCPVS